MSDTEESAAIELAHRRFKTIVKLALGMVLISAVVGSVGGTALYQKSQGPTPGIVILMPTIVSTIVTGLPVLLLRRRWFDSPEAILAAAKREPYPAPCTASEASDRAEAA